MVVQVMVAEVVVIPVAVTAEITGAAAAVVAKVKFGEVAVAPAPAADETAKL